ncbi:acetoacetate decarboxylase family protein [Myxosarcina sp. GI1]|uniref:acetoacetate decarboxylase family protein n=1 Tax=Myxosarcina sp. GI1 TaxID=1541065 RepID=UPI00055B9A16|nr:acetoacetate decarboxylase family protein [Myxosarcina sp. GI1]
MNYPSPPWKLKGSAIQSLNLIDVDKARLHIPPELDIISILPGKTLGGIYISAYKTGSVLQYNELIVVAGLTRHGNKIGAWISHIYVDSETSVAGGREIWGLPKEMAEFTWERNRVEVKQGDRLLCSVKYQPSWFNLAPWWQPQFIAMAFGGLKTNLLLFVNQFSADIALLSGEASIPQNSPFASLNLDRTLFTFKLDRLNLNTGVPKIAGTKSTLGSTAI